MSYLEAWMSSSGWPRLRMQALWVISDRVISLRAPGVGTEQASPSTLWPECELRPSNPCRKLQRRSWWHCYWKALLSSLSPACSSDVNNLQWQQLENVLCVGWTRSLNDTAGVYIAWFSRRALRASAHIRSSTPTRAPHSSRPVTHGRSQSGQGRCSEIEPASLSQALKPSGRMFPLWMLGKQQFWNAWWWISRAVSGIWGWRDVAVSVGAFIWNVFIVCLFVDFEGRGQVLNQS